MGGKTGTAEYYGPRNAKGELPTHGWYTGFAPVDKPEIAVTVFVEQGTGTNEAAPIATRIFRNYFSLPDAARVHRCPVRAAAASPPGAPPPGPPPAPGAARARAARAAGRRRRGRPRAAAAAPPAATPVVALDGGAPALPPEPTPLPRPAGSHARDALVAPGERRDDDQWRRASRRRRPWAPRRGGMEIPKPLWRRLDPWLLLIALALVGYGLVLVHSATYLPADDGRWPSRVPGRCARGSTRRSG